MYIPCIPKQKTPENEHLVDKECIADYKDKKSLENKLESSKTYLGRPQLNIVANSQRLDLKAFGKNTIISEATLT